MYEYAEELEEITDQEVLKKTDILGCAKGTIRIIAILWRK